MRVKLKADQHGLKENNASCTSSKRILEESPKLFGSAFGSEEWRIPDCTVSSWPFTMWRENNSLKNNTPSQQPSKKRITMLPNINNGDNNNNGNDGQLRNRFRGSLFSTQSDLNRNWRKPLERLSSAFQQCSLEGAKVAEVSHKSTSTITSLKQTNKYSFLQAYMQNNEKYPTGKRDSHDKEPPKNVFVKCSDPLQIQTSMENCTGGRDLMEVPFKSVDATLHKTRSVDEVKCRLNAPIQSDLDTKKTVSFREHQSCMKLRDFRIEQLSKDSRSQEVMLQKYVNEVEEKDLKIVNMEGMLHVNSIEIIELENNIEKMKSTIEVLQENSHEKDLKIETLQNKLEELGKDVRWYKGALRKKSELLEEKLLELRKLQGHRKFTHVLNPPPN